jgi:hypothetical protein
LANGLAVELDRQKYGDRRDGDEEPRQAEAEQAEQAAEQRWSSWKRISGHGSGCHYDDLASPRDSLDATKKPAA